MAKGGPRPNAGRKSYIEESERKRDSIDFRSKLMRHNDEAIKQLGIMVKDGNLAAIKLLLEYLYGRPKESVDVTTAGEQVSGITVEVIRKAINEGSN